MLIQWIAIIVAVGTLSFTVWAHIQKASEDEIKDDRDLRLAAEGRLRECEERQHQLQQQYNAIMTEREWLRGEIYRLSSSLDKPK